MTRKYPFEVGDIVAYVFEPDDIMPALILDVKEEGECYIYSIMHLEKERFGNTGEWVEYKHLGNRSNNYRLVCEANGT